MDAAGLQVNLEKPALPFLRIGSRTSFVAPPPPPGVPDRRATASGTLESPWDLRTAGKRAHPGDTLILLGGSYPDRDTEGLDNTADRGAVRSGNPPCRIRYVGRPGPQGPRPIIQRRFRLEGVAFLDFDSIEFLSTGRAHLVCRDGTSNISILNCIFNQRQTDAANLCQGPVAISIQGGDHFAFNGCVVGRVPRAGEVLRYGSDFLRAQSATDLEFSDNDFSQAEMRHAAMAVESCRRVIIQGNFFRNPIARAVLVTNNFDVGPVDRQDIVLQNNLFFDCDWDGQGLHPCFEEEDDRDQGDGQSLRFSVVGGMVRNNLFVGQDTNPAGTETGFGGALSFNMTDALRQYGFIRCYHNTYFANAESGVFFSCRGGCMGDAANPLTSNVRFVNDVFVDCGQDSGRGEREGFEVRLAAGVDLQSYRFVRCYLFHKQRGDQVVEIAGERFSATMLRQRHPRLFPLLESKSPPEFANASIVQTAKASPEALTVLKIGSFFQDLSLVGPLGSIRAAPLATIRRGRGRDLELEEGNAWFFTPGFDIIDPDEVAIVTRLGQTVGVFCITDRLGDSMVRIDRDGGKSLDGALILPTAYGMPPSVMGVSARPFRRYLP